MVVVSVRKAVVCFVLVLTAVTMHALDADLIGLSPAAMYEITGPPQRVFVEPDATGDDSFVVFLYEDYSYVYFFDNAVWQLRIDDRSSRTLHGVRVGDSIEELAFELGPPRWLPDTARAASFRILGYGVPIELTVFVDSSGRIEDLYLSRMDF